MLNMAGTQSYTRSEILYILTLKSQGQRYGEILSKCKVRFPSQRKFAWSEGGIRYVCGKFKDDPRYALPAQQVKGLANGNIGVMGRGKNSWGCARRPGNEIVKRNWEGDVGKRLEDLANTTGLEISLEEFLSSGTDNGAGKGAR
ncbi:hypothetical protein BP5796_03473 [Coleophoma crateriformis]|uniref:Uncharacterized protein n=1 Tax=Coleophoma crateriformis TaxID=565419 RepID=A0A3D8SN67_9HELO|nr:hypothetical protein BP5796_03473 [Coleophoma crateriformis]